MSENSYSLRCGDSNHHLLLEVPLRSIMQHLKYHVLFEVPWHHSPINWDDLFCTALASLIKYTADLYSSIIYRRNGTSSSKW